MAHFWNSNPLSTSCKLEDSAALFIAGPVLIGLLASIVGQAAGARLAMVLTWVINLTFFGWTRAAALPVGFAGLDPRLDHRRR
jgi:hypothetical protein